jgi:V8-like Glu-specific endopeptidase
MHVTGPDTRQRKQRRRRYAAAVLCLGTLSVGALGTFLLEQRAAHAQSRTAAPTLQTPASQPVAYPLGSSGAAGLGQERAALRPTSSGTAGPATVNPGPRTPSPSAVYPDGIGSGGAMAAPFAGAALAPASEAPSMTVSDPLAATPFAGLAQVGAIFAYANGATSSHYCTGSVVSSPPGDIVITAAHCVYDSSSGTYINGIAFAPGYHDGQQPYGAWTPSKILVPQQWINSGDPDYDVAFLVVHQSGSDQRIQDQVGAELLGLDPSYTGLVQVVGYPGATEQPVTCTGHTKELSATQLEFDCPGFPDGTSGGPFLADVDQQTGRGTVVGVIGGYQTGGDTPDISYSAYFGSAVADLFDQAEAAG